MATPKAQTLQQRFGFRDGDLKTPKHDEMMLWLDENIVDFLASNELWTPPLYDFDEMTSMETEITDWIESGLRENKEEITKREHRLLEYEKKYDQDDWYIRSTKEDIIELKENISLLESVMGIRFVTPDSPPLPREFLSVKWEVPITSGRNQYTIGFIDMVVQAACRWDYSFDNFDQHRISITRLPPPVLKFKAVYKYHDGFCGQKRINIEVKTKIPSLGELIRQIRMYQTYTRGEWVVLCPDDRFKKPLASQGIKLIEYNPSGQMSLI